MKLILFSESELVPATMLQRVQRERRLPPVLMLLKRQLQRAPQFRSVPPLLQRSPRRDPRLSAVSQYDSGRHPGSGTSPSSAPAQTASQTRAGSTAASNTDPADLGSHSARRYPRECQAD